MDLANVDMTALAKQLCHPEGEMGMEVGKVMEKHTEQLNMFALDQLQLQPTDHVLEIGFGPGVAIAEVARQLRDGYADGIDQSKEMLAMASERNRRAIIEDRVTLKLGTARSLPYADGSFDKVFAVNVFHFWPEPAAELAECLRVLKSGGIVLFYLTHPSSWPAGFRESGVFIAREPEEVEALLQAADFRKTEHRWDQQKDYKGFVVVGVK
ncbi:MAG: class I SAM-dependent methyltransferase [Candidatus Peregrinibacteria bacterium]|nr:class I SAM-dependent methyltransferase [Candidatus Peregrinibacteria bacterium]